jgi:hypothetical protein
VRWTHLRPNWLDHSIDYWLAAGYEPVFLLDDWEVPLFRERFATTRHVAAVAEEPAHEPCTHAIYVYRLVARPGLERAVRVPRSGPCE